jgi:hypothetical protein
LARRGKNSGFVVKAIRQIVRMRQQDAAEREAREALVQSYLEALGGLADLPLGKTAMERAGLMPPV